ncbi:helix-turn-helix domain-containing protein, partial [Pseudomonas aeruginosa]
TYGALFGDKNHKAFSRFCLCGHEKSGLAEPYLRDYRLQIVDIAMLLGYSEHSAFTRAFKEWGGHTPHEFRRLHVAEQ